MSALASLNEAAVPYVAPVLRHRDPRLRTMAAKALGKTRSETAVDALHAEAGNQAARTAMSGLQAGPTGTH